MCTNPGPGGPPTVAGLSCLKYVGIQVPSDLKPSLPPLCSLIGFLPLCPMPIPSSLYDGSLGNDNGGQVLCFCCGPGTVLSAL